MLKLKRLSGDINWKQYGAKWITKKLNNGDFDYWLIVDFMNFVNATGEKYNEKSTYVIEIHAVAPSEVSEKDKQRAIDSIGIDNQIRYELSDEYMAEILNDYGIFANLHTLDGNNADKLMKETRNQIQIIAGFMFDFAMDKPKNRIGTTGWEMIRGDIMAPLNRTRRGEHD